MTIKAKHSTSLNEAKIPSGIANLLNDNEAAEALTYLISLNPKKGAKFRVSIEEQNYIMSSITRYSSYTMLIARLVGEGLIELSVDKGILLNITSKTFELINTN